MFALSIRCLKISVYQYITMVYWYSDIYTVLENIRISMYHNFCKVIQKPCHHQRNSSVNTNWVKSSIALAKTDPGEAKRTEPDGPVSWTHPYCVRSPQWPPPSTQVPSSFSWSHSCLGVFIWGQTNLLNIDIFKHVPPGLLGPLAVLSNTLLYTLPQSSPQRHLLCGILIQVSPEEIECKKRVIFFLPFSPGQLGMKILISGSDNNWLCVRNFQLLHLLLSCHSNSPSW